MYMFDMNRHNNRPYSKSPSGYGPLCTKELLQTSVRNTVDASIK